MGDVMMQRTQSGAGAAAAALIAAAVLISIGMAAAPPRVLEYVSLNVIGEPPINGLTWTQGMQETGGEWGMKAMGVAGLCILVLGYLFLLKRPAADWPRRSVKTAEIAAYFVSVAAFSVVNMRIGYAWWDPAAPMGMGPLFWHSMAALAVFGLLPDVFRLVFKTGPDACAARHDMLLRTLWMLVIVAFGYGLWSGVWHCCSFFAPKMYFFFFVTKLAQLLAVCSFFFRWGFKMFMDRLGPAPAYAITAVCFGLAYPWHTVGFAVAFGVFGLVLCDVTRRTGSWLGPALLLYMAYIFHAGLPWHGAAATLYGILPVSLALFAVLAGAYLRTRKT
jgi:hypothetical protein